eukprot:gb/GECH01010051.1/.p1 GENE.gb/GECH01010051.1/~~gb/GECH01010051.1/.p1  ORF type:complete len:488 (+),score=79.31 gb/GECH01010051.1/:1-1464(+)
MMSFTLLNDFINFVDQSCGTIFAPFYHFIDILADKVNLPPDATVALFFMFSSFPLALIHRLLIPKNSLLQHIYSLFWGLILCFFTYGWGAFHLVFLATSCYILMILSKNHHTLHKITFGYAMIYLCGCHLYRMWTTYTAWNVDVTGTLMVATLKVISISFNYDDGRKLKVDPKSVSDWEQDHSIPRCPTLFEYMAYIFFYPCVISGPAFDYTDYQHFTQRDSGSQKRLFFRKMAASLLCFWGVYLSLNHDGTWVEPPLFTSFPLWIRPFIAAYISFLKRMKYYAAWLTAEACCALAGFGLTSTNVEGFLEWEKLSQANFLQVEFYPGFRDTINYWNYGVARWVRYYVYLRYKRHRKKGIDKTVFSFAVMALWHGLFPGYFLTFIISALMVEVNKAYHRKLGVRIHHNIHGRLAFFGYRFLTWIAKQLALGYATAPFWLLTWNASMTFFRSLYFAGHILTIGGLVALNMMPSPRKENSKSNSNEKKQE